MGIPMTTRALRCADGLVNGNVKVLPSKRVQLTRKQVQYFVSSA